MVPYQCNSGLVPYLCHSPEVKVQDPNGMVVSVCDKQLPLGGVQTETTRLRELSMLKRSVEETAVACPSQSSATFGCRLYHFDLG